MHPASATLLQTLPHILPIGWNLSTLLHDSLSIQHFTNLCQSDLAAFLLFVIGISEGTHTAEDQEGNSCTLLVGSVHHVQVPLQTQLSTSGLPQ